MTTLSRGSSGYSRSWTRPSALDMLRLKISVSAKLPDVDVTRNDLDVGLPAGDCEGRSYGDWAEIGEREGLTLGELARRASGSLGGMSVRGSGVEIADIMHEWMEAGACDGFNLHPAFLPG